MSRRGHARMPGNDRTAGQKRGIRMTFPPSDMPYFIDADRTRLKQVLINLLRTRSSTTGLAARWQ